MPVLLTHADFLCEDPHELGVMKPYPPLGLLYVNSHLKARGIDAHLCDTTFARFDELQAYLHAAKPPVVGIYSNLMTRANVLRAMAAAREAGNLGVGGGAGPANYHDEYLRRRPDLIAIGQGRHTH